MLEKRKIYQIPRIETEDGKKQCLVLAGRRAHIAAILQKEGYRVKPQHSCEEPVYALGNKGVDHNQGVIKEDYVELFGRDKKLEGILVDITF